MKKQVLATLICLSILTIAILPTIVMAQDEFGLNIVAEEVNVWGEEGSLESVVPRLINIVMSVLGIIAVVIILIGGFMWMTAAGNEERVGKAKQVLVAGVIGLLIVIAAYAIANFVITKLYQAVQD